MAGSLLDRAFGILERLSTESSGMPLQAIADQMDIPKSAAHRLLGELAKLRYVRQDKDTGRYFLTTRLVSLGFRFLAETGIVDVSQPILDELARQTRELVRLSVTDGETLTWVAKAQGALSGLRYDPDMGRETALFCSASGFAWLSTLSDEDALALVMKQGFGKLNEYGPNAPRTVPALLEHLKQTRERGYSVAIDTYMEGMAAMATPVRHPVTGRVLGVVSIAGPTPRLSEAKLASFADALMATAAELSEASLGSAYLADVWFRGDDEKVEKRAAK
ncbi:IclR family transcriptional regulator [Crenobacter sp. SG2303]|uniref:IclR family transcriptional regulator n=1 Tax=Crenobacter oryzisoli TaxID=3056844 RepID=A0ABT7XN99_9NEIS|nr:IclR family transcriptional regulator [Crenobacter sp. SG2303]MDN0075158.1 IclR family transcriptional regulator [Crenobacter sp. SG2303]